MLSFAMGCSQSSWASQWKRWLADICQHGTSCSCWTPNCLKQRCVSDMEQWLPQSIPPSWTAAVTRLQETTMPRLSWPAQRALLAVVLNARWNERRGGWEGLTKSGFDSFWGGFVVCYAAPGWWRLAGVSDCADPIDVAERLRASIRIK